ILNKLKNAGGLKEKRAQKHLTEVTNENLLAEKRKGQVILNKPKNEGVLKEKRVQKHLTEVINENLLTGKKRGKVILNKLKNAEVLKEKKVQSRLITEPNATILTKKKKERITNPAPLTKRKTAIKVFKSAEISQAESKGTIPESHETEKHNACRK
ncbi:MAG: hypothetical protein KDC09_11340, partial [Bacteroidales bacterium]|nr:hypothetical protein [Bacteroidales bacterium]